MADRAKPSIFFRPARSGLAKFCGELEAKIMEVVWANGPMTVKRALYFLNKVYCSLLVKHILRGYSG